MNIVVHCAGLGNFGLIHCALTPWIYAGSAVSCYASIHPIGKKALRSTACC